MNFKFQIMSRKYPACVYTVLDIRYEGSITWFLIWGSTGFDWVKSYDYTPVDEEELNNEHEHS